MNTIAYGITVLLCLVEVGFCYGDGPEVRTDPAGLTQKQVDLRIADLRRIIMPPVGTSQQDVQSVFGEPSRSTVTQFEGDPHQYPLHLHCLLGDLKAWALATASPCASLQIIYQSNRVYKVDLWHKCTHISRPYYKPGTEEYDQSERHWAELRRQELAELIEIHEKYREALEKAKWNANAKGIEDPNKLSEPSVVPAPQVQH